MTTITKQVIHTLNTHINTVVPNPPYRLQTTHHKAVRLRPKRDVEGSLSQVKPAECIWNVV